MSGIMSDYKRRLAVARLRAAAEKVFSAMETLDERWRDFPENERDEKTPSPIEIVKICDRMEREWAEEDASEGLPKVNEDKEPRAC